LAIGLTLVALVSAGGCGSDPPSEGADQLDGIDAELVITRQRDLLDRGLINVMTDNGSGHDLILSHRRLVADHFATEEDPGTTSLRAGRRVAIQLPYGRADDCESDSPVTAVLSFDYVVVGDTADAPPATGTVDVGGTDILDGIRAKQCAAVAFDASTDTTITVYGGTDYTLNNETISSPYYSIAKAPFE